MTNTSTISNGGLTLHYRAWQPNEAPRAIIAIVPGFNSHSGYYEGTAQRLVAAGYAAYAIDLRGRGKSDGERFYVDAFEDYVSDVETFVSRVRADNPARKIFVLGHSAGGVVACLYTLAHQDELAGLVCESFAFKVPAPDFALAVFKGLAHIAPHAHVLRLKNEDFSRDQAIVDAMNADPLIAHETQPTKTLAAMVRGDELLERSFGDFRLPLLIMHGTKDKATRPDGSEQFYANAGSTDKTLKLYDGAYHDLLNDTDRDAVMGDILSWLQARA